ncbi:LysR family transcriptional regulator [Rhodococcus koreensis]
MAMATNLLYLSELARRGSFIAAATELGVTPSTLSRAMRKMENDLSMELFITHGRNIRLSPEGIELAKQSERALTHVETGLHNAALMGRTKVILRVGLLRSLGADYMPEMVRTFVPLANMKFAFREGSTATLTEMVRSRDIDLAVVSPPPSDPEITVTTLFEQRMDLVVAAGSALASQESIDLRDVAEEDFILPETSYGSRSVSNSLFERAGVRPSVILETDDMAMAVAMAGAGIGVALAPPTPAVQTDAVRIPLRDPQARRIVACCHMTTSTLSPHGAAFLRHLVERAGAVSDCRGTSES